jgi:hypothetical protein
MSKETELRILLDNTMDKLKGWGDMDKSRRRALAIIYHDLIAAADKVSPELGDEYRREIDDLGIKLIEAYSD